jgi:aminodeoxyfutalosine deaminase
LSIPEAIQALPKIELHLHLEGTLRPSTVRELAFQHDPRSAFAQPDWDRGYWTFNDLPGFLSQIDPVLRASLRTPEDWHRAAVECFEDLAAQSVVYAEVSVAARLPGRPGYLPIEDILAAVEDARRSAPLPIGLIVGMSRHAVIGLGADGPRAAVALMRSILSAPTSVVGVDLHGDEQSLLDLSPLQRAFALAREGGLRLRVHAGEAAGPESIWNALRQLQPDRIGHGNSAIADPALVQHLAEQQIALDLCPTSNVRTGAAASIAAHPIRALFDAGAPVTVSSDDPLAFQTNVTTELLLLHEHLGFSLAELEQLTSTARQHAFQSVVPALGKPS